MGQQSIERGRWWAEQLGLLGAQYIIPEQREREREGGGVPFAAMVFFVCSVPVQSTQYV